MRSALFLLVFVVTLPALGQVLRSPRVWPQVDEAQDFGVAPRATLRLDEHAAPIQARLASALESASGADRARTLVFFCAGPRCWLSYNAALRAARLGYSSARWYRGGVEAWGASGGALTEPRVVWRRAP